MKRPYIITALIIMLLLALIGINGQYHILDRITIKNRLVEYKEKLCNVDASNANDESYLAYKQNNVAVLIDLHTSRFKPYFTEDAFKAFWANRMSTLYYEYVDMNPTESLTLDTIKFDTFNYDSEQNRYIIYYTMTIKSSSGLVFTEHNQSVITKEKGTWLIQHEKIFLSKDIIKQ